MGSSLSHSAWVTTAVVCGLLFLMFDAARHFAHRISPVTLRRWSGDAGDEKRGGWSRYDPRNFRLLHGAILQVSLLALLLSTIQAVSSVTLAVVICVALIIVWKFALAFVPEDTGEAILRQMVPLSYFFYYLFWPLLAPMRRLVERRDRKSTRLN